MALFMDAVKT